MTSELLYNWYLFLACYTYIKFISKKGFVKLKCFFPTFQTNYHLNRSDIRLGHRCQVKDSLRSLYLDSQDCFAIYWAKYCCRNIFVYEKSVFTFQMAPRYGNRIWLEEKKCYFCNILPKRYQYHPQSLGKETWSCPCTVSERSD